MKDCGLVSYVKGPWLMYGYKHGFGRWLPENVRTLIVNVWNPAVCFFKGHVRTIEEIRDELPDYDPIDCLMCCTPLTDKNRQPAISRFAQWLSKTLQ